MNKVKWGENQKIQIYKGGLCVACKVPEAKGRGMGSKGRPVRLECRVERMGWANTVEFT